MSISTAPNVQLTTIIGVLDVLVVAHADVMAQHVGDRAGSDVCLVDVAVLAHAHRFGSADGVGHGHAHLATTKLLATVVQQ